jgi:hypothetical protein
MWNDNKPITNCNIWNIRNVIEEIIWSVWILTTFLYLLFREKFSTNKKISKRKILNIIQGKVLWRKVKKLLCVLFGESAVLVDLCYFNFELIKLWNVCLTHKVRKSCQMEGCQEWRKFITSSISDINKIYAVNIRL